MQKFLIVGLDIGTTTGISIYDLKRNLIYLKSKRNFSSSEIMRQILKFGNPLVIATDKEKIPTAIRKIASSFDCKIFKPDHDLGIEEKNKIVKIPINDDHERDALAAATFAFRFYEPQFKRIENTLASMNLIGYEDIVKEMLIKREAKNIADAIEKIKPKEERKEVEERQFVREISLDWKEKAKEYERKLKDEKKRNEILKIYSEKLEERLKNLERQKQIYLDEEIKKNEQARKEILKNKEIKKMEIIIKQLRFELSKQKSLLKTYDDEIKREQEEKEIMRENLIPVIIVPDFTKEAIVNANKKFNINNRVIWFKETRFSKATANVFKSIKPKVIIGDLDTKIKNKIKDAGIIVLDQVKPKERNYYAAISPREIKDVVKKVEKRDFLKWLEEYKERQIT